MALHEFKTLTKVSLTCDTRGCSAKIEITDAKTLSNWSAAWSMLHTLARYDGWSRWRSRSARDYCPDHGPKPGHKMERIYGGDRAW